jgi:hypothetical protein
MHIIGVLSVKIFNVYEILCEYDVMVGCENVDGNKRTKHDGKSMEIIRNTNYSINSYIYENTEKQHTKQKLAHKFNWIQNLNLSQLSKNCHLFVFITT